MKQTALAWNQSLNLTAYSEVESPANYSTPEELESYRRLLLEKSGPPVQCIKDHVRREAGLKVLELCSGSSRLLYALEKSNLLDAGYGVEVSPSRNQFAEQWKESLRSKHVTNVRCAVAEYEFPSVQIDLVVMIDGALSYLYPCDPELPRQILKKSWDHLVPKGMLLLEFDVLSQEQINAMKRDGRIRTWNKGDDKDAFRYALYQTESVDWEHMVVQHTSTYLHRDGVGERTKRELYKFFRVEELERLFEEMGFTARYGASFSMEPFTPEARSLVVLAVKR